MKTLPELSRDLASGKTTSEKLVRVCLDNIADPAGEGSRAFIKAVPLCRAVCFKKMRPLTSMSTRYCRNDFAIFFSLSLNFLVA